MNNNRNLFALLVVALSFLAVNAHADGTSIGAKITDFSVPITGITYHKDKTVVNVQSSGSIGDLGVVGGTLTAMAPVSPAARAGLYTSEGAFFRPDDKVVSFSGQGTWKALGKHTWRLNGVSINAEGGRSYISSVLSLDGMSISGSAYALD